MFIFRKPKDHILKKGWALGCWGHEATSINQKARHLLCTIQCQFKATSPWHLCSRAKGCCMCVGSMPHYMGMRTGSQGLMCVLPCLLNKLFPAWKQLSVLLLQACGNRRQAVIHPSLRSITFLTFSFLKAQSAITTTTTPNTEKEKVLALIYGSFLIQK